MKTNCGSSPESITEVKNFSQIGYQVKLICQCGANFERNKKYLEQTWRTDSLYKLKCVSRDNCVDKRLQKYLRKYPKL
jgi:hypothetical protein